MREPDVTLTDFGLALLCFGFAAALIGRGDLAALFAGLYAALGVAAFLGALSHGWFWDRSAGIGRATWLVTMLMIGAANLFLWLISARFFGLPGAWGSLVAFGQFGLYAMLALFVTRSFLLSSGFSLPPTLVLLAAFVWTGNWLGAAGLFVALAGAVQQAARIRGLGLTHNALYHVIQALAFTLVFVAVANIAAVPGAG